MKMWLANLSRADKHKPIRAVSIVALVIVIGIVILLVTRVPPSQTVADTPLLGKSAPPIQGTVIQNTIYDTAASQPSSHSSHSQSVSSKPGAAGRAGVSNRVGGLLQAGGSATSSNNITGYRFSWAAYRGHWVLVDFFASWCPPCQEESPQLLTFAMEHRGSGGVSLVGVAFDDPKAAVVSFMQSTGITWPVVIDSSGKDAVDYGVTGPPEAFLVDPSGKIVEHIDGAVTLSLLNSVFLRAKTAYDHALVSVSGLSGSVHR